MAPDDEALGYRVVTEFRALALFVCLFVFLPSFRFEGRSVMGGCVCGVDADADAAQDDAHHETTTCHSQSITTFFVSLSLSLSLSVSLFPFSLHLSPRTRCPRVASSNQEMELVPFRSIFFKFRSSFFLSPSVFCLVFIVLPLLVLLPGLEPRSTLFYWVSLGFIGFYRVSLGFTGFYWVLFGFTGL